MQNSILRSAFLLLCRYQLQTPMFFDHWSCPTDTRAWKTLKPRKKDQGIHCNWRLSLTATLFCARFSTRTIPDFWLHLSQFAHFPKCTHDTKNIRGVPKICNTQKRRNPHFAVGASPKATAGAIMYRILILGGKVSLSSYLAFIVKKLSFLYFANSPLAAQLDTPVHGVHFVNS